MYIIANELCIIIYSIICHMWNEYNDYKHESVLNHFYQIFKIKVYIQFKTSEIIYYELFYLDIQVNNARYVVCTTIRNDY